MGTWVRWGQGNSTEQSDYIGEQLEARRLHRTWLRVVCGQGRREEGRHWEQTSWPSSQLDGGAMTDVGTWGRSRVREVLAWV